jgi:hypothetical protein
MLLEKINFIKLHEMWQGKEASGKLLLGVL